MDRYPTDVSPDQPIREGTEGPVFQWTATRLPAYGTSTLLHVAVGLIAWFLSMQVADLRGEERFRYKSDVVRDPVVKIDQSRRAPAPAVLADKTKTLLDKALKEAEKEAGDNGRGFYKPGGDSFLKEIYDLPKFCAVDGPLDPMKVFGTGGSGGKKGGIPGLGSGTRGGGRGGLFPPLEEEQPCKIVYIVDRSGSMTDSLDIVKYELKESLGTLSEGDQFHVIFFSSGPPVEMPTRRLVNATERDVRMAFDFVDNVVAQGETDPTKAIERAFACKPDVIYLLTDGEFDRGIIDLVARLSAGGTTKVNTIGFLYTSGTEVLKEIASKTGGEFKLVTEKDLETIVRRR
jgi:hypothetical protein